MHVGINGMEEKLEIRLPRELADRMDEILEYLGFDSRKELALSAIRRLIDHYTIIAK